MLCLNREWVALLLAGAAAGTAQYTAYPQTPGQQYGAYRPPQSAAPNAQQQRSYTYEQVNTSVHNIQFCGTSVWHLEAIALIPPPGLFPVGPVCELPAVIMRRVLVSLFLSHIDSIESPSIINCWIVSVISANKLFFLDVSATEQQL